MYNVKNRCPAYCTLFYELQHKQYCRPSNKYRPDLART